MGPDRRRGSPLQRAVRRTWRSAPQFPSTLILAELLARSSDRDHQRIITSRHIGYENVGLCKAAEPGCQADEFVAAVILSNFFECDELSLSGSYALL
jgi:hypothetical protein